MEGMKDWRIPTFQGRYEGSIREVGRVKGEGRIGFPASYMYQIRCVARSISNTLYLVNVVDSRRLIEGAAILRHLQTHLVTSTLTRI